MRLKGKVVVVTGASAGMGRAIAERFVREGADVVAVARREHLLKELVESLADAPGKITYFVADVGERDKCEAMVDFAVNTYGRLDVLINNAGIMDDMTPIGRMSDEMLDELMRVNTYGPLYAMRKAVQVFLEQGDGGNIINTTSVGAAHQTAGAAYCASKAALAAVTRNTAFMYQEEGIRCNAIAPGGVLTDIAMVMPPSDEFGMNRISDLLGIAPEMGMPEDIANIALFLASDEAGFVNGATITADRGWTAF